MRIMNRANLPAEEFGALAQGLPEHGTLSDVFVWARSQEPPVELAAAITQDEFTHDIILRWRDGLYLAYGAT